MIKAFAFNKNGKIELTLEGLQKLLEEAEAEGRRLAEQPTIVYRQCPIQTASPTWRTNVTCQDATTVTGNGRATSDFSYVTVPQNITGEKTFAAGEKSALKTIDEIKSQFGIKAEG